MDLDRFDALARQLVAPTTRRATLGTAAVGGILSALGLARAVPETRAAPGNSCVLSFMATVRQGPSLGQGARSGGNQAGEVRGELRFSLSERGNLDDATLTAPDGTKFPVVGQSTGHSLQLRVDIGRGQTLVAIGVGEHELTRCQGAIDGLVTGPAIGDLGDWHAAALRPSAGSGGSNAGTDTQRTRTGRNDASTTTAGNGSDGRTNRTDQAERGRTPSPTPSSGSTGSSGSAGACATGQSDCAGRCVDRKTSVEHCGACGNACAASQRCQEGVCTTTQPCTGGRADCDGTCVDLNVDVLHCGTCDAACVVPEVCVDGKCQSGTTAPTEPQSCAKQGESCATAECCIGSCGQDDTCECVPDGAECFDDCCNGQPCNADGFCGTCTLFGGACTADADCCSGSQYGAGLCCSGVCTDVTNLGFACPCAQLGASCTSVDCCVGFCGQDDICDCVGDGQECRGNECCNGQPCNVDGFCGSCSTLGSACDSDGDCCQGDYAAACCFDGTSLTTRCTDVTSIGFVCPGENPNPATSCGAGLTLCDGECVDIAVDAFNCGACGASCGLGGFCQGGACASLYTCEAGLTQCGVGPSSFCTDVNTDSANCSACGVACAPGLTCCFGACVDLLTDVNHCGNCGGGCFTPIFGDATCENGQCN